MRVAAYLRGGICLAMLSLGGLLGAPAPDAAAAVAASGTWAVQRSPDTTLPGGMLDSVSCSSAGACTAVGTYQNVSGLTATLAVRWNGARWGRQAMPNLPGVTSLVAPQLGGVSCPSARLCVAVGGTGSSGTAPARAASLVWNGQAWRLRPVPLPAGTTDAGLSQVSCVTRTFCEAVGSRGLGTTGVTLAEVWRGSRWRVQRSPNPLLHGDDEFSGVSCVSPAFCEAVGYNVITDAAFAERWNGVSWRVQSLLASAGFGAVISCASARFCEAVGSGAARWNGTSWRGQQVPRPAGASFIDLTGVSCVSPRFCDAVGASGDGVATVAWRGSSWRLQPVPPSFEASTATKLSGVWCAADSRCDAAGQFTTPGANRPVPLAARWNGRSWVRQHAPAPPEVNDNTLAAVSCVSATFCAAVGSTLDRFGNEIALAQMWDGSSWTIASTTNPARADGNTRQTFDAVSCVSATFCAAVGESSASPGLGQTPGAGAQIWNGKSWRMVPIPGTYELTSVSCLSERFCLAVGGIAEVDQWNGHSWSPRPSVAGFVLGSISCASTHFCDAIGSDASGIDAETWNGTIWQPQPNPPPPHGVTSIILNAVSCATQHYCVVVAGTPTDLTTGAATAVADVWNGHAWTTRTMPANPKATGTYANAVSCTSTTSCTAVGLYSFGTPPLPGAPLPSRTLAETWNGNVWKVRATPNPNPTSDNLNAVSCGPGQTCTAVGSASDLGGAEATLIETGS